VLNADFGAESTRNSEDLGAFDNNAYYGVMLGARVAVVDEFGVALRGEYFHDTKGFLVAKYPEQKFNLWGGTLTFDYLPSDFLTIRMDNRLDWADHQIFNKGVRDDASDLIGTQFTTTLGVVAHTD
jgi:hypothetical protein